ncbi:unnamed protein product [Amaranthus hypochondriacus]
MTSFEEPRTPINGIPTKNTNITTPKFPSSRRTLSLSSSPSLSSNSSSSFRSFSNEDSPPPTPPQRIPFSWEKIPGIPKHQIINSPRNFKYLPLPPPAAPVSLKNKSNYKKNHILCRKDPFFAALVECSKNDHDHDHDHDEDQKDVIGSIWKASSKSLSHRFGFVNFSCKNTCSVSQSLVFLPTREQPRRISYGLVKKTSR